MQDNVITEINKQDESEAFVSWYALPKNKRRPKTQKEFARMIAVRPATLTEWKKHPAFMRLRKQKMKEWGMNKTPEVLQAVYRRAIDKSTQDAKLWLEMIENLKEERISGGQFNQFNFFSIRY